MDVQRGLQRNQNCILSFAVLTYFASHRYQWSAVSYNVVFLSCSALLLSGFLTQKHWHHTLLFFSSSPGHWSKPSWAGLAVETRSGVFAGLWLQLCARCRQPHAGTIEPKGTFVTKGWRRGRGRMKAKPFIPATLCFRARRKLWVYHCVPHWPDVALWSHHVWRARCMGPSHREPDPSQLTVVWKQQE